jgi:hypothetical protein
MGMSFVYFFFLQSLVSSITIFGLKRDEVIGSWRKLHNEELHKLYSSPSIIRMIMSVRMRWTQHVAHMGKKVNAHRILEGNRPLGRPRHRWEEHIKMDLGENGVA